MSAQALPAGYGLLEYRIEKVLGVGGFGLTYLATDANLNLKVALKEYLPGDIALRGADQTIAPRSPDTAESFGWGKQRFLDESRTLASFRHPNIVRVMRFFEAKGSAYMVMEFVEGAALGEWVKARRPIAEAQAAAIVAPLLDGLEVVHKAGFLHRDIKPGNIYVRDDGSPVLLDFGSARQQASDLTAIVTPGYAPFEQYHTQGNQGPWSDLYALAGVLYWMVTGNPPAEAAARVREDKMPGALTVGDHARFRAEFLRAIDWALMPFEDKRPQSVAEWRARLLSSPSKVISSESKTEKLAPQPKSALVFDPALLGRLEAALAQHAGPIAPLVVRNAARKAAAQPELIQLIAAEIGDPATRAAFEKAFSEDSRPTAKPPGGPKTTSNPATAAAASRLSLEVIERAERRLAEHLGGISRVLVKRAALKAHTEAELYLLLSEEIANKEEKKAFMRKGLSKSGKS
jgi:serine/threonine protein kinase